MAQSAGHTRPARLRPEAARRFWAIFRCISQLVEKWGGIDILVNNAAINRGDNFATTTDRAWDEVIHTNVDSLFAVTKPIYKQMIRQRKGTILNITSIGAMRALPTAVH